MAVQISKKRKFVADGIFKAELNEFLTRELAEDGYSGVEVRVTPTRTEIIILATRTQNVLGEKGRRIRELTAVVQKRFGFPEGSVELYAEKVATRGLCAIAQAESLRYKLLGGLAVRRACYGVLRFIMESGAKGCEVVVSGKLRGQRAKSMKFVDGLMIHSGDPVNYYVDTAVRHVLLRQGEQLRVLVKGHLWIDLVFHRHLKIWGSLSWKQLGMFIFLGISITTLICKNQIAETCQIQELVCLF
uniref:Small ribosomal subunit protein uS3 n=1 Tax=Papio anubis TaxID=9555 RepID=A0A2I3NEW0_PAPAN